MLILRASEDRGYANHQWLQSYHTFSFSDYYDQNQMGFSDLRVVNDDTVQPGMGFHTHGHKNMEIISYVIEGELAHKDSEGNIETIPSGDIQLMSAGSGIMHSEFNASKTKLVKFLQIWIQPNKHNTKPSYQQKTIGEQFGLVPLVSSNGKNESLIIKQDVNLYQLKLKPGESMTLDTNSDRNIFIHQVKGQGIYSEKSLEVGDALKVTNEKSLILCNKSDQISTSLIFDLR